MTVQFSVMSAPSSRQIRNGFSVPSAFISPALMSSCRLPPPSKSPFPAPPPPFPPSFPRFQLEVDSFAVDMRQVKVDHRLPVDAEFVFVHNFENCAGRHVARDEVAVLWIPLFQEVPAVALGNGLGVALVSRRLRNPDASALAASRF